MVELVHGTVEKTPKASQNIARCNRPGIAEPIHPLPEAMDIINVSGDIEGNFSESCQEKPGVD